jgi:hypothetical protein
MEVNPVACAPGPARAPACLLAKRSWNSMIVTENPGKARIIVLATDAIGATHSPTMKVIRPQASVR